MWVWSVFSGLLCGELAVGEVSTFPLPVLYRLLLVFVPLWWLVASPVAPCGGRLVPSLSPTADTLLQICSIVQLNSLQLHMTSPLHCVMPLMCCADVFRVFQRVLQRCACQGKMCAESVLSRMPSPFSWTADCDYRCGLIIVGPAVSKKNERGRGSRCGVTMVCGSSSVSNTNPSVTAMAVLAAKQVS